MLINTAGGLTGGDAFSLAAEAEAETQLTLTTQAAERAYRAQPNQQARVQNHISVKRGARVNWMPQETILFQGSALLRNLRIDMGAEATALVVEPLVFGRAAMGETLTDVSFSDKIEIYRGGALAYLDTVQFQGDLSAHMARPFTGAGAGAMANVVLAAPNAEAWLEPVRAMLGPTAGASLLKQDILVLRLLAADSYLLRQTLIPVLNLLTNNALPRCWMT